MTHDVNEIFIKTIYKSNVAWCYQLTTEVKRKIRKKIIRLKWKEKKLKEIRPNKIGALGAALSNCGACPAVYYSYYKWEAVFFTTQFIEIPTSNY